MVVQTKRKFYCITPASERPTASFYATQSATLRIEVVFSHCRQDIAGGAKQALVNKTIDPSEFGTSRFCTSRTVAANAPVPSLNEFEQANFERLDGAARPSCASST